MNTAFKIESIRIVGGLDAKERDLASFRVARKRAECVKRYLVVAGLPGGANHGGGAASPRTGPAKRTGPGAQPRLSKNASISAKACAWLAPGAGALARRASRWAASSCSLGHRKRSFNSASG